MQTKVICNAMINSKDMIVVFWFVKCNKGNIFIFSKLIMNENENNDKVNGKVFLIIKNGPGLMGSLMHSLIKIWRTKDHTINIKDCNKVHIQMNSYGHHVLT
jgi:hypothetical protein